MERSKGVMCFVADYCPRECVLLSWARSCVFYERAKCGVELDG